MQAEENGADFFPQVSEEIVVVEPESKALLNYFVVTEVPEFALINMLEGPTANPG